MFKSKSSKAPKPNTPTAEVQEDHWLMMTGKENREVNPPMLGPVQKETPWAGGGKGPTNRSGRKKPRTSSLSQLDAPPDRASEIIEKHAMNRAFERMLDELQIPSATRSKLVTLETPVKAAMLKSSHVLNVEASTTPSGTKPAVRKSKSTVSLESKQTGRDRTQSLYSDDIPYEPVSTISSGAVDDSLEVLDKGSAPWMRHEFSNSTSSLGRSSSPIQPGSTSSSTSRNTQGSGANDKLMKERKDRQPGYSKDLSPEAFAAMLQKTVCTDLEVEKLKKLRLMLRNEAAG